MKKWTLAAAIAAASGIAWFGLRGSRAESPEPQKTHQESRPPAAETQPRPRPRLHAAPPPAQAPAPAMEDAPAATNSEAADPDEGQSGPTDQEIVHALDTALRSEPVDSEWGRAIDRRLQDYFQSERAAGSALLRSECRSTLCKIEVRHTAPDAAEHFSDHVSSFIPPGSQAAIQPKPDASTPETVVYFTRQGGLPLP